MIGPAPARVDPFAGREPVRPAIPKEERGYICPNCDLVLADGVSYQWCPVCFAAVDWVDLRKPVWACGGCDAMINEAARAPWCEQCECKLLRVHEPKKRKKKRKKKKRKKKKKSPEKQEQELTAGSLLERTRRLAGHPRTITVLYLLSLLPILFLALDDGLRWSMIGVAAPFIFMPVIIGVLVLSTFGASWQELKALVNNRKTRVIHGLEHATLVLLERDGAPIAGGHTRESSFITLFRKSTGWGDREKKIRRALQAAVNEIQTGNGDLVYDRRCGTSYLVGALMLAVLGLVACALAFLISMSLTGVMLTFAAFAATMAFATRPLGLLAQRLFTVSNQFSRARLVRLVRKPVQDGLLRYEVFIEVTL